MSIIDEPAVDFPTLYVPHAKACRIPNHPTTHCYRERELEDRVIEDIQRFRRLEIQRQPVWKGIGIPDIVTVYRAFGVISITIFELKAVPIGERARRQIQHYVLQAQSWAANQPDDYIVSGVLVGFAFRPIERRDWLAYWPVDIADAA